MSSSTWHEKAAALQFETRSFIGGDMVEVSGGHFETINPASGAVLAAIGQGAPADIDRAVADGLKAFKGGSWSRMAPRDRMAVLYRFADLIEKEAELFALLDTLDMGKPISDMLNIDVPAAAHTIRFLGRMHRQDHRHDDRHPGQCAALHDARAARRRRRHRALELSAADGGVEDRAGSRRRQFRGAEAGRAIAALRPFISPASSSRPAARRASSTWSTARVKSAGTALALHMDVAKVSFTGSTEVGKLMMIYVGPVEHEARSPWNAAAKPRRSSWATCPTSRPPPRPPPSASTAIWAKSVTPAPACSSTRRSMTSSSLASCGRPRAAVPGDPLLDETNMGPLVTFEHQKRVLSYIDIGKKEGASLAFGGNVPQGLEKGAYVAPALFTGVNSTMRIAQEEIFGPVAAVIPVDGLENAIEVANDTIYGLAAGIWTTDLTTAPSSVARNRGRHDLGELLRRGRHDAAFRRLQAVRQCPRQMLRQCSGLYPTEIDLGEAGLK